MKRLLLALVTGLALLGVANVCSAQHHGSGLHGASGFQGGGEHQGSFHHAAHPGGLHHFHHGHHRFFFVAAPFFWGLGFYPYLYPYASPLTVDDYLDPSLPYAPQPQYRYYCPDQGYYPSVLTCPTGWLRVVPESPAGM